MRKFCYFVNFCCFLSLAVKEILLEAAVNKQRANEIGASGWYVFHLVG